VLVAGLLAAGLASPVVAQRSASEYELKAAFLYNFARFVEWDASMLGSTPFVLGVVADDTVLRTIENSLAGKTVHDHPLVVRRLKPGDAADCHALFVVGQDHAVATILQPFASRPVLTVGEGGDFVREGGMIAFVFEESKLRFDVNSDAAERAGIKLSSQLLKVARRVIRQGGD
jgi:hypothetical protein